MFATTRRYGATLATGDADFSGARVSGDANFGGARVSGAALFVCPSVYEPFGIINLEAMACECPVVATRVGGIPEAVADGETGTLVPFDQKEPPDFEPRDPERFAQDLAAAIDRLLADPASRQRMGKAGRARVEKHFSWASIARKTVACYEETVASLRA